MCFYYLIKHTWEILSLSLYIYIYIYIYEGWLWSNTLRYEWSCGLVHCPGGNANDPIWRVLASTDGISSWTPLKPQRNLTLTVRPINSGVLTSLLLQHLSSSLTDSRPSLNLLCHSKTDAQFMQDAPKAVWSIPNVAVAFYSKFKT